jgi:hypothetical protein
MYEYEQRRYEMLARVCDFGATYGHLFPRSTVAAEAFAAIASAIERIEGHDVAVASASISRRATGKEAARRALLEHLKRVAATTTNITN